MASYLDGTKVFDVDVSDLQRKIAAMEAVLNEPQVRDLLRRTVNETAKKVKTISGRMAVIDYAVTQAWVKSQFKSYKMNMRGMSIEAVIPISGHKGTIGGRFKLSGRKRKISARVVKKHISKMPPKMKNQGGNPPFIGPNDVVFTRRTKKRLPIVRVVGLGVPQMPLNLSHDRIQDEIIKYMGERLEHNFQYMFGK